MKKILLLFMVAVIVISTTACNSPFSPEYNVLQLFSGMSETEFSKQVVYDKNGVKVTATALDYMQLVGPTVSFVAEGNTDKELYISLDNVSVNGIGMSTQTETYTLVPNEEQEINFTLELFKDARELLENITAIGTIEFNVCITDKDGNIVDVSDKNKIVINESIKTEHDKSGEILYSQDGVTVYKTKNIGNQEEYIAKLLVTNETQNNLTVGFEGVVLNGEILYDSWYDKYIPANQVSYICLYSDPEVFVSNNIDKVEKALFSINVFNNDIKENINVSDPIELVIN